MRSKALKLDGVQKKIGKATPTARPSPAPPTRLQPQPTAHRIDKELFAEFNTKFEASKKALLERAGVPTRGRKRRIAGKEKLLRRKWLAEFLGEPAPPTPGLFDFTQFSAALDAAKCRPLSAKRARHAEKRRHHNVAQSVKTVETVMSDARFQQNPLEVMRLHLLNTHRTNRA